MNVVSFPKPRKGLRLSRHKWKQLRDDVCSTGRCVGCGRYRGVSGLDAHHVYAAGKGGDDVFENLVPLCGSGTTGCHGATETSQRCIDPDGTIHDPAIVRARIRRHVADSHGHLLYLVKKLDTVDAARAFLDRYYPEGPTRGVNDAA